MRLHSFQIKGFKSIIDTGECRLTEDNILVLAGQNEAGKSAVLEALDFFRNGPSQQFEQHQARLNSEETEVVCKFEVTEKNLRDCGVESDIPLADYLKSSPHISFIRKHTKGSPPKDIALTEEAAEQLRSILKEPLVEEGPALDADEPGATEENLAKPSNNEAPPAEGSEPPAPSSPAKPPSLFIQVSSNLIKMIPPLTLYTSFGDLLPSEVPVSELSKKRAIKDFEKVFDANLTKFAQITDQRTKQLEKERIEERATDDFNQSWTQSISSIEDSKYSFLIVPTGGADGQITFMLKGEDNQPLYVEQKSLGFRWFSAFHLRLRAMMKTSDTKEDDGKREPTEKETRFILLIDEPGQNLHDIAQRDVKKIIEETADKNIQILYSTHNPNLIGIEGNEFTRIRLVSNNKALGTKVETVSQYVSNREGGSLDALSPLVTAMGLTGVGSVLDPNKFNVVVEGITDHYYLSALQKLLGKDEGIRFIPACGVDNVKHIVSVLLGWGYNFKAIFDDDQQQGRKAYNQLKKVFFEDDDELAHEHIYKAKEKDGIEDLFSALDFKKYIAAGENSSESDKSNSSLAKAAGKELLARLFLERVSNGEETKLDAETKKNFEAVFDWLYKQFGIPKAKTKQDKT